MNEDYAADIVFGAVVGGIVGAKIWYVLLTGAWDALFGRGGFVWYGGVLGGGAGGVLDGWRGRIPPRRAIGVTPPPPALGYGPRRGGGLLLHAHHRLSV